jgi:cytochrome c-type biogenesis protein CcmE
MDDEHTPQTPTEGQRDTPAEAILPVRGPRRRGVSSDPHATRRGLMIVVPLVMGGVAIAGLILTGMKDNAIYSKPVDELVAQKSKFSGRPVRAEGMLVHGTLTKRETPCEYRFTIEKNGVAVPVRYAQCIVPDTFRDVAGMDVGVTVEGEILADNSFEATSVLAKCPSKYEMKDRAARGEQMPHVLTPGSEAPLQPALQPAY